MKRMKVGLAIASLVVGSVALTGTALARDYSGDIPPTRTETSIPGDVLGETETAPTPEVAPAAEVSPQAQTNNNGLELPFTGGDVAGLAAIGAGLVGAGVLMTRARRRPTTA